MKGSAIPFAVAAWLFLGGVILQVFFAGMGLFKLTDWTTHTGFGWLLASVPLFVVLPTAALAQVDRRTGVLTILLVIAASAQPELAAARETNPVLAAFHPVNALAIFGLAWFLARRSLVVLRTTARQPDAARPATEASGTSTPP